MVVGLRRGVEEAGVRDTTAALRIINQTDGFDCPGCAWPERRDRHLIEFCENGAKAVADAATHDRCTPQFFATHSIAELARHDDHWLNQRGRLTAPMIRREDSSHYEPITWDAAFALIGDELRALASPDQAAFYTSGRTSNEAAFLYQLMVRGFGTNNLPDCSNMCHESTSVALAEAIGIGKGTVTFEDFDATDLVIVAGQNPGTNHPRMLGVLEEVKRRGGRMIAVNPLPEAGLLRFRNPQRPSGVIGRGTLLADVHLPIRLGGDQALFRWFARRALDVGNVDNAFIDEHTSGFEEYRTGIERDDPEELAAATGLTAEQLNEAWAEVVRAERIIICWAMGITQHRDSVSTIRDITNFALLTGNIGRPGAGLCPVRGHSNVQGDRTMGVWDQRPPWIDRLEERYSFVAPRERGLDAVKTARAMQRGEVRALVSLGGNLARVLPESGVAEAAMASCRLTVHISTKLNRSHLVPGEISVILPTLTRTDEDWQASDAQFVTVEDSFGTVHSSRGRLAPPAGLLSEIAIVCRLARQLVPDLAPWASYEADYSTIRRDIAAIVPGFERFEERVTEPGGFLLPHPPRDERRFETPDGRAQFGAEPLHMPYGGGGELVLQTIRSHDQFNSTIYGLDDRYRGVAGGRRVVFVNRVDLVRLGLADGDLVDLVSATPPERVAAGFRVVEYDTPPGDIAAYYPEANVLSGLDDIDPSSGAPSYKSIPVRMVRSRAVAARPSSRRA